MMYNNHLSNNILTQIEQLFEEHFGQKATQIESLPISGSDRRYYRLSHENKTAIGTYNSNVAENNSYFYFTELFKKHQINVPEIYKISKDRKNYIQQDLGNVSLFDQLMSEGLTKEVRKNYHLALEQLAKAQWLAGREANYDQCFATKKFDEKTIKSDLYYFKYYFVDVQNVLYNKSELMDEIERLSKDLSTVQPQMLMYRDFQSRNIMMHNNKPYLIDFQGSMQGPVQYDLASLLWQAKAQLPEAWKEDLLNGYVAAINKLPISKMDEVFFRKGYAQFVLLRLLQVLGAYGYRGLLQKKPHFISSIAPALKNLETFLNTYPQIPAYPELRSLLEKLSTKEMQAHFTQKSAAEGNQLTIKVQSFSYKKGIPTDSTTHGGGYVFDCRGILNPGRFEPYKHLSGRDAAVQDFLRTETKMPEFLDHVFGLVSLSIDEYLERGFDYLSVSFGCTGGQHRSVFAAEQLVKYIKNRYNIETSLEHLNRDNWVK